MPKPLREMSDSELRREKHAAQRLIQEVDRTLKQRRERKRREAQPQREAVPRY
jgi:hypothetical protein